MPATADEIAVRCESHTALRAELHRQGPLHVRERDLLLEAADALLFDEPEAQILRVEALQLLQRLEDAERRTSCEAARLRNGLEACGAHVLIIDDEPVVAIAA
jgi:hypothetical protein